MSSHVLPDTERWGELARFAGVHEPQDPGKIRAAFAYIDKDATIGERTVVSPFCYIGPWVTVGADCFIGPGTCIGQPGFGYETEEDGSHSYRTHQEGVVIGDDVHIGANTCIDQGRHRPTRIGRGSRIDNLVHIAHNVEIGENCQVIACAELSGSVVVEDGVIVSPGAIVRDWRTLREGSRVGLGAVVVTDVPPGEVWAGVPARKFS